MRLLIALMAVATVAAPVTTAAGTQDLGPPETLASEHDVVADAQVEAEFPVDFLGVLYEGDVEGGAVRFRRHGR